MRSSVPQGSEGVGGAGCHEALLPCAARLSGLPPILSTVCPTHSLSQHSKLFSEQVGPEGLSLLQGESPSVAWHQLPPGHSTMALSCGVGVDGWVGGEGYYLHTFAALRKRGEASRVECTQGAA